jgi:hypothetical protein
MKILINRDITGILGYITVEKQSLPCFHALSIRTQALLKFSESASMPMNLRPRAMQTTPVVPEPMKGSQTEPFGGTEYCRRDVTIVSGF